MDLLNRSSSSLDELVIVHRSGGLSRRELVARVEARKKELLAELTGVGPADGVRPLEIDADVDGIVELLATWSAGLVAAPLNTRLTDDARRQARTALSGASPPVGTSVILWTSGTSGRARGVALSWANLEASAQASDVRLGLRTDDVWLASLSLAHVGGLALVTRALLLGSRLIVGGRFDVVETVELLEGANGPTHVSLVPTQLHHLLDAWGARSAPSRLRCVLIGGAHAPHSLVERAIDGGWPVALTYGATEMSSQIATAGPDEVRSGRRDVGLPLDGVEVRVGDDGELLVRGITKALGYVGDGVGEISDDDGWYHTGDLGEVDEEGRLSITGRRIDRIVTGGVTLDAVSLEEDLRRHPAVLDVCVVGVPDAVWGERVAAWVEPIRGEFDLDDVESWVAEEMTSSHRPRLWKVGDSLPRNSNGKVDRAQVRLAF